MKISSQPEFNNVCLVDRFNDGDYLIFVKMHKNIHWEVDYVFESGVGAPKKHFKTLVVDDKVFLTHLIDEGFSGKLLSVLEEQTNMLVRKVKKNIMFL